MAQVQILYWQEIPSLVRIFADDGTFASHQLPDWFQQEIDNQAMEQGLVGSDAYLEQWRWGDIVERPEPADEVVKSVAAAYKTRTGQSSSSDAPS